MKQPTIALIGLGNVGSTIAHTLLMTTPGITIMLVDINESKCKGEEQDLDDANAAMGSLRIVTGTLPNARQADVIIISAGIGQTTGQTRLELLETNKKIVQTIINDMHPINKDAIIIVVTNPVDILTHYVQQWSDLPRTQVFGSGTLLDTVRLKEILSKKMNINPLSINIDIVGEHGDSQCVAWSSATVNSISLEKIFPLSNAEKDALEYEVSHKAYDIIACKGSTSFGVAACVELYCHAILYDEKKVIPVSCFHEEYNATFSSPAVIGKKGIEKIIMPTLNNDEKKQLQKSVKILQENVF